MSRFVIDYPVEIAGNATAPVHTGAMIALVPTEDDAGRLAVDGGLPADELHCTIKYLGEAADISEQTEDVILQHMEAAAAALDVIDAEGFALAIFNPPGYVQDDGKDRDPCVVLMLSGEELAESYEFICSQVHDVVSDEYSHMPWIPHITLIETGDADLSDYVDQVGPITFDRIRVAFAGENYDFPLGSGQFGTDQSELETSEPPQMPEQDESVGSYTVSAGLFGKKKNNDDHWKQQPRDDEGQWTKYTAPLAHVDSIVSLNDQHPGLEDAALYYQQTGYHHINSMLRTDGQLGAGATHHADVLSSAMTPSREDIDVFRGIAEPRAMFGDAWNYQGDNTGLTWQDKGFTSTTTNSAMAGEFSDYPGAVKMRVHVPAGAKALHLNPRGSSEFEILLDKGTKFRIVKDSGYGGGSRIIDVEVIS